MLHYWSLDAVNLHRSWVTIGTFDGVHLGHQKVVSELVTGAHRAGAKAVVLTFYPHPADVLRKGSKQRYLTTPEQQAALLSELGVDVVITHPFTKELSSVSARDFVALLVERLGMEQLWVGYDFALGHNREGDVNALTIMGQEMGYGVHPIAAVEKDGQVISSSLIRSLIRDGQVSKAASLLGRPYSIEGVVVPGDGRGHLIGFPTANLAYWDKYVMPSSGVYVCQAEVDGQEFDAVTNVGVRPTFDQQESRIHVEAYLLDVRMDLYDQSMILSFFERLRDEQRFESVDALIAQIQADVGRSRDILARIKA